MAKSFDNDKTIYSSFNEEEITSASQELIKNLPAEETKKTYSETIADEQLNSDQFPINEPNISSLLSSDELQNEVDKITRRDQDEIIDTEVTLQDHDYAVKYYIENVIKPHIFSDGVNISVPLIYQSPEKFSYIKKNGFYRDRKNRTVIPLITFTRTGFQTNSNISMNKLDANNPQNYYVSYQKYTSKNSFNKFDVLNGITRQGQLYQTVIPDYITLNYDFMVWTQYISHMNPIIEALNYAKNSYWGEPGKYNFYVNIESFNNTTDIADGEDRAVRTTFSITMNGYLLPKSFNNQLTTKIVRTPSKIVINSEIVTTNF